MDTENIAATAAAAKKPVGPQLLVKPVPIRVGRSSTSAFSYVRKESDAPSCHVFDGSINSGDSSEFSYENSWHWQVNSGFSSAPITTISSTSFKDTIHQQTPLPFGFYMIKHQDDPYGHGSSSHQEVSYDCPSGSFSFKQVTEVGSKRIISRKRKRSADIKSLYFCGTLSPPDTEFSNIRVWENEKGSKFYDCKCGSRKAIQDLKKLKEHVHLHCKSSRTK